MDRPSLKIKHAQENLVLFVIHYPPGHQTTQPLAVDRDWLFRELLAPPRGFEAEWAAIPLSIWREN